MNADHEMIHFSGAHGERLAARLDLPLEPPRAYVLFAHCFTCSKDSLAAARLSAALTSYGIAVLRFDFTGLGGSAGDFSNTNFSSNVRDLVLAGAWLREHHQAPHILVGHSLGGSSADAPGGCSVCCRSTRSVGEPLHSRDTGTAIERRSGKCPPYPKRMKDDSRRMSR